MKKYKFQLITFISLGITLFLSSGTSMAACAGGNPVGIAAVSPNAPQPINTVAPKSTLNPTSGAIPQPTTQQAYPVVAKVVWIKGTLKVMGADRKVHQLQKDSPINLNDTLITTKNSQAEVVFSDHSIVTFQENTQFYIKQYSFHPEVKQGSVGKYIMDLVEGGYRTATGLIAKSNPPDYSVNTQVAIMGVRGTDYAAYFHSCHVDMKLYHGKPTLHNAKGIVTLTPLLPYASVASATQAPITLTQPPAIFNQVSLPITPATFTLPKTLNNSLNGGASASGAKACTGGSNGFSVNFNQQ